MINIHNGKMCAFGWWLQDYDAQVREQEEDERESFLRRHQYVNFFHKYLLLFNFSLSLSRVCHAFDHVGSQRL
jgi:hypothetical protein